ncbi:MAG: transglutaminase-like domain-containing protein [Magnetococcus sp. DMHC-8]
MPWAALAGQGDNTPLTDRLTPSLFTDNRPVEQDGSGRTARLARLVQQHHDQRQPTPTGWADQVKALRNLSPLEQLRAAHLYVNRRMAYVDRGQIWKTPQEAFASGGVCVEFATSKLLLLRDAGFPEAAMRVITLRPLNPNGIFHVILLARLPDGSMYVLDSPDRAQSADIVPLASYRERIRPVVWSGWSGGFSSNDHPQTGPVGSFAPARHTAAQRDRTSLFASGDRLVDIAADLRVVRPGERPLTEAERRRLALLRRYYHAPTEENRRPLTQAEVSKLHGIRAKLDREDWVYRRPDRERINTFVDQWLSRAD